MSDVESAVTHENLDLWFVYVVHTDNKNEYAQVNQFVDWKPSYPEDFDTNKKYTLRTNKWRADKKYDRCKVHILRVGETLEELERSVAEKRPRIPRLVVRDSDYMSDFDGITIGASQNNSGKRRLNTPAEAAAKKSKADVRDMDMFASQLGGLTKTSGSEILTQRLSNKSAAAKSSGPKEPPYKNGTPRNPHHLSSAGAPTQPSTSKQSPSSNKLPSNQVTPQPSTSKLPAKSATLSRRDMPANCHSTGREIQNGCRKPPTNSKVIRNEGLASSSSSAPENGAKKFYTEADIRSRDEELERLKQQLTLAQTQLAKKDEVILEEIRSLSRRVANIEEAVTSKCRDYLHSVQLWVDKHCDNSCSETSSSQNM